MFYYKEGFGRWVTCQSLLLCKSVLFKKMGKVTPKKDEHLVWVCWWITLHHGSVWGGRGKLQLRYIQKEVRVFQDSQDTVGSGCGLSQISGPNDTEHTFSILHKRKMLIFISYRHKFCCIFVWLFWVLTYRGNSTRQKPSQADVVLTARKASPGARLCRQALLKNRGMPQT